MNGKQLKNSILQWAIQGKLVPQDANDEPAIELLKRFNPKVKPITEEVPFEVPESWVWVRLGDVGKWQSGATPSRQRKDYYGGDIPWIKTGDLKDGPIVDVPENITQKALDETSVKLNPAGSVLMAMYAGISIGKLGILISPATTNQACCACVEYKGISQLYLFYFLLANRKNFVSMAKGSAQHNISKEKIVATPIPIPPLAEQKRIVEKIEELMPLVERYTKAQEGLDKLNAGVKGKLRASILQEAIQGKLVPQDASEEPAIELLKRIHDEKARLVKEGKIKKDKNESVIFRDEDGLYYEKIGKVTKCIQDEIPFDIPDGWEWVRVHDIVQINPKNTRDDDTLSAFIPMEKIEASYGSSYTYDVVKWGTIKKNFTHFANGDVAFAKITPCFQNRKSVVFEGLPNGIGAGTTELKVLRQYGETINRWYLLYFLKSAYFIERATFKGTANQQRIVIGYLENKLFPLPPLEEQKRIVAKIEELFGVLDRL